MASEGGLVDLPSHLNILSTKEILVFHVCRRRPFQPWEFFNMLHEFSRCDIIDLSKVGSLILVQV